MNVRFAPPSGQNLISHETRNSATLVNQSESGTLKLPGSSSSQHRIAGNLSETGYGEYFQIYVISCISIELGALFVVPTCRTENGRI